jgi:serine O-acetyltransferase
LIPIFELYVKSIFFIKEYMNYSILIRAIKDQKQEIPVSIQLKQESQRFTQLLFNVLFDQATDAEKALVDLEALFRTIRDIACPEIKGKPCKTWQDFTISIPELFSSLKKDATTIYEHDPAAHSIEEVYLAYPGFFAIAIYRMAREFYTLGLPLIPRLMTEYAHQLTGIDIHPGAQIGNSFFIDHGTGVVIGETTEIHDNVKIYQGVTLGALKVSKRLQSLKRHPTIEKNVIIYANASILGGDTVIGENSIIGGNTWLTKSVPKDSIVVHRPDIEIISKNKTL